MAQSADALVICPERGARATGGAFLLNNQMWLVGGNTSLGVTNDVLHSNP